MLRIRKACRKGCLAGEQKALKLVAAGVAQHRRLLFGLDAFGDHHQTERVTKADDGARDGEVGGVAFHVMNEGAVDFQTVERQAAQIVETGIAGAEVVDRKTNAEFTDFHHARQDLDHVFHQR